jgi:hypothetical protein
MHSSLLVLAGWRMKSGNDVRLSSSCSFYTIRSLLLLRAPLPPPPNPSPLMSAQQLSSYNSFWRCWHIFNSNIMRRRESCQGFEIIERISRFLLPIDISPIELDVHLTLDLRDCGVSCSSRHQPYSRSRLHWR